MKRLFDIFFSLLVLSLFFPFGLLIALLVVCTSRGGIFFLQNRVGKNGVPFKLIKFRTMRVNAEKSGSLTVGMKDPRITRIGVVLRKYKLDEFPQFINVLLGTMSIVGPRPEVKEYVDLYTEDQKVILTVKPGITDYASIEYFRENELLARSENPRETYINEIMPDKIKLNQKYIREYSLRQDVQIVWKTAVRIFKK